MNSRRNRRGYIEHLFVNHLKLNDLKKEARGLRNPYLFKDNILDSPQPEFHVSHLKHDTNGDGLCGIRRDSGFKNPNDGSLLWWSLSVGADEIMSAERRLLEQKYPDRTEEQVQKQQSFLWKFATSPAFEKTSRLGSYRFTFPLEEVLNAYSEQFCSGTPPVMRVFRTSLFKQEVMYAVLVHSPANEALLSDHPLLTDNPNAVCAYRDGHFIWRPESMCETHRYRFVQRDDEKQMEVEEVALPPWFYVWDHVGIALHVDEHVLEFDADRLRENLKFCCRPRTGPTIIPAEEYDDYSQAKDLVEELWPNYHLPLVRV